MEKSKTELLEYGKKILMRGDGYTAVARYLERNAGPGIDQKYIIEQLVLWEKANPITPPEVLKAPFDFSIILGILFIVSGILIAFLLWDYGLIGTLPLILVGAGILGIMKKVK